MASLPNIRTETDPPHILVAHALRACFRSREAIDARLLRQLFVAATERSDASGGWSMRHAYDALELAQTLYLLEPDCPLVTGAPGEVLDRLASFAGALPVQSCRSERQLDLQQFSTPLPLAFLVGVAGQIRAGDTVLEPSAGNGLIAAFAGRAGARLLLNEIDPHRRSALGAAFPAASLSGHDAELIDDLLDPYLRPDLVLMNPPFARSHGRGEDPHAGARHLRAAIARLAPGGRLVAIMPESFSRFGSGRALRAKVDDTAALRLDALVGRGAFAKHGTGVAVRLMVYDKVASNGDPAYASVPASWR